MPRFNPLYSFAKLISVSGAVLALCITPLQLVHAETGVVAAPTTTVAADNTNAGTLANPLKFKTLDELIDGVLAAVVQLGGTILLFMLVWTGFKFIAARGNEEKIRDARRALMWTIIGGLILLGATAIKAVVQATVTSVAP